MISLYRQSNFLKSVVLINILVFSSIFPFFIPQALHLQSLRQSTDELNTPNHSFYSSPLPMNGVMENLSPMAAPYPLTNYTLIANLNPPTNSVSGFSKIFYVNHINASLDELVFHIYPNAFRPEGNISVSSVKYNGSDLSYTISGPDLTVLAIDLIGGSGPGPLAPDNIIELDLNFSVYIPYRYDRFGWYNRTEDFNFLAYNLANWFPIVAVYENGWDTTPYSHMGESFYYDVATYDAHLTVPSNYIVAATGELQGIITDSGTRTWHYLSGPVRDFTWCAGPNYQTSSLVANGVNITSYHVPSHEAGGLRVLEVAEQCLDIFGSLFGAYPWSSLKIVEADFWAGGMEYPQLVMIGSGLYSDPNGISSLAITTAHEIAHEWVPYSIGTDSNTEPWIDEGFASFAEYVWVEFVYGLEALAEYRLYDVNRYWMYVNDMGDECINQSMDYWHNWYAYGSIVYVKAALVYDMLRYQVGNETFYQAWQYLYSQALHQNVRARTLQQYFESYLGESLAWYFNQWVYGAGIITLNLGQTSVEQIETGWRVTFELHQSQSLPIRLRVPIGISYGADSDLFDVWMANESISVHSITVNTPPVLIMLDPNQQLICKYNVNIISLISYPGNLFYVIAAIVLIVTISSVAIVIIVRRRHRHANNI